MPTLLDWRLGCARSPYHPGEAVWVHGIVADHPRFPDGEAIHTSPIVSARSARDALLLTTRSGSEYRLPLNAIDLQNPGYTGYLMEEALELEPSLFSTCLARRKAAEDALFSLLSPGTLRLSFFAADRPFSGWFCCQNGEILPIKPDRYDDLGRDVMDFCHPPQVDFRSFPAPDSIELCHIGETITRLEVENRGLQPFFLRVGSSSCPCPPGQITALDHAVLEGFRANPDSHCCKENLL